MNTTPDLFRGLGVEQDPLGLEDFLQVRLHLPDYLVQLLGREDAGTQCLCFLKRFSSNIMNGCRDTDRNDIQLNDTHRGIQHNHAELNNT